MMYNPYVPQEIEPKWQREWEKRGLHRATQDHGKPKFFCLDFFPYPSGEGLHVGHCRNYVPTDVISRFYRMHGYNVLHPMGWDAFGEPAEQFAIAQGVHPRDTIARNTANFRRQMTLIGTSYDWSREINSSDPTFYHWTQWFFLLLYKRGLAYRDTNWQWWCPSCQTTLSSHEAAGGVCWRGHPGVTKREIPAWYFKITTYADELLFGLDQIDWPEHIKTMQRNWIGRSEGFEIDFNTIHTHIIVFTTRPDTIFGVTFLLLAPEHPGIAIITTPERRSQVEAYCSKAASISEVDRMTESREKTGVFTGGYAIHPISGENLPIWIADYVLPTYGTGAIMGVPAHDSRDFEFAQKYNLPHKVVIIHQAMTGEGIPDEQTKGAYVGSGQLVNSGSFDGLVNTEAVQPIGDYLEENKIGRRAIQYRMHDWLISRQRYWGAPIPIIHCPECGITTVPEDQLPVMLPEMQDFQPDGSGRSPLARVPDFVNTTCPQCGKPAQRETDTMGGFACSSWYFSRFTSPDYQSGPFESNALHYWMPVDLYVGGAEHAVLHLLYARFWTKVMADAGIVPFREPFTRLLNQGQLMGPDGRRMSKSRGNVITPDSVIQEYGADALRVYELFMAPFEQDVAWNTDGIIGVRRFLIRIWNLIDECYFETNSLTDVDSELERLLHQTIRRVSQRIEDFRFNTMISALMEFSNSLFDRVQADEWHTKTFHKAIEILMVLLAPAAPHISEEMWELTGHQDSVHLQSWPIWDAQLAQDPLIKIPIQIDGKLRDVIEVQADIPQGELEELAFTLPKIKQYLKEHTIDKVVYIPGKILSFVTQR